MVLDTLQTPTIQEAVMEDELVSFVRQIVSDELGWSDDDFIGECVRHRLSIGTAKKLLEGDTNITTQTLATVTKVLRKKDIGAVMNIRRNGGS